MIAARAARSQFYRYMKCDCGEKPEVACSDKLQLRREANYIMVSVKGTQVLSGLMSLYMIAYKVVNYELRIN